MNKRGAVWHLTAITTGHTSIVSCLLKIMILERYDPHWQYPAQGDAARPHRPVSHTRHNRPTQVLKLPCCSAARLQTVLAMLSSQFFKPQALLFRAPDSRSPGWTTHWFLKHSITLLITFLRHSVAHASLNQPALVHSSRWCRSHCRNVSMVHVPLCWNAQTSWQCSAPTHVLNPAYHDVNISANVPEQTS